MPSMPLLAAVIPIVALTASWGLSEYKVARIEREVTPSGERVDVGGYFLNVLHVRPEARADLPPIVFIHGASGNLLDQAGAFRAKLEGRAELLFVDRPGYGFSDRGGPENDYPDGQADSIARAMDRLGIDKAIIVGHSFGGAIAASFAVLHPEKTLGLLFLSPATHPWPGGVDWYYTVAAAPVIGPIFSHAIAPLAGASRLEGATRSVFAPNPRPDDYVEKTAPELVLRPATFRANAIDVANLHSYVIRIAPRYGEIKAPTVIITGDSDPVVLANIHSTGLARDIKGAELVWLKGVGHKTDYVATDRAIEALGSIARRAAAQP